jgi:hypothetical protein
MPAAVKPDTEVVARVAFVKVNTAGLAAAAVQAPVPVAVIVAVEYWQMVWAVPALGLALTVIAVVSVHPFTVQMYLYTPATVKPLIRVVGEFDEVKEVVTGLVDNAVHIPEPVAAIVAVEYWQMVWLGPELGLAVTVTRAVSLHPLFDHISL